MCIRDSWVYHALAELAAFEHDNGAIRHPVDDQSWLDQFREHTRQMGHVGERLSAGSFITSKMVIMRRKNADK